MNLEINYSKFKLFLPLIVDIVGIDMHAVP